jgi:phosphoserine aminotransferase
MQYSIKNRKPHFHSKKKIMATDEEILSNKATESTSDLSSVFGYDIKFIKKDLYNTILVTFLLITVLLFLSWFLPNGVLS